MGNNLIFWEWQETRKAVWLGQREGGRGSIVGDWVWEEARVLHTAYAFEQGDGTGQRVEIELSQNLKPGKPPLPDQQRCFRPEFFCFVLFPKCPIRKHTEPELLLPHWGTRGAFQPTTRHFTQALLGQPGALLIYLFLTAPWLRPDLFIGFLTGPRNSPL